MKMQEIRDKAQQLGLKPGRLNKAALIRAIQSQEGHSPCFGTAMGHCEQMACCWREDCLR